MATKKTKDVQFTFEDAKGKLRVVHVQVIHDREAGKDSVKVIATSDGVPVEATARVGEIGAIKTARASKK